jgi:hypothetical protein
VRSRRLTVRSHCNTNKRYITSEGKSYSDDSPPPSPDQLEDASDINGGNVHTCEILQTSEVSRRDCLEYWLEATN